MFARGFLKEISPVFWGVALAAGNRHSLSGRETVLQEVSHNYGLREGPCQLFLVTWAYWGRWVLFSEGKSHLGAGHTWVITLSEGDKGTADEQFSGLLQVAERCWWNVTKYPGCGGESEILRSLVVFFHGFAVTINLFLLNKNNRCLKQCCPAPNSLL
jgi:hypothetical protein